jgi:hypothetical protein
LTEPSARAWRALCPSCGAPVDFQSAASASAVCGFCRSTLVREGDALRRIGVSAEIIDDHTPLQLGVTGRLDGEDFALVGRLQLGTDDGPWNEWRAVFGNGREGWLSEDNGQYVFVFDAPAPPPDVDAALPARLQPGAAITIDGRRWGVASRVDARLLAAQGELKAPPPADRSFVVVDVRNPQGEVGTLAADDRGGLTWSVGRAVRLADLKLVGTRESNEKTLAAKTHPCPSCGAPLTIALATSQSVVCPQCKSVVDLSKGIGPDMAHYAQENAPQAGAGPRIPLGRVGRLALGGPVLPWQAVGYVERCEVQPDDDGGQSFWHEYLLYHPTEGFAFLVDTADGWAWVKTLTGAPGRAPGGTMTWDGKTFSRRWEYDSVVTYVLGEFYWKVERDLRMHHVDWVGRGDAEGWQLNQEMNAREVTWSLGAALEARAVAAAFKLPEAESQALVRAAGNAGPPDLGSVVGRWAGAIILIVVILVIVAMCSHDECAFEKKNYGTNSVEYRTCRANAGSGSSSGTGYGGSYGGWSSGGGGGHK